jgi:hypothetical protein
MTIMEIVNRYLLILLEAFEFDVLVFSTGWVIYPVIPAIVYLIFFSFKWAVLTAPIWMPFAMVFKSAMMFISSNKK